MALEIYKNIEYNVYKKWPLVIVVLANESQFIFKRVSLCQLIRIFP